MEGRSENTEEASPPAQGHTPAPPEHLDEAVRSVQRNEQLDGTRRRADGDRGLYEPTRRYLQRQQDRWVPYRDGAAVRAEEEEQEAMAFDENMEEDEQDTWIYDEGREKLIRVHKQARKAKFTPSTTRGCPVPVGYLTSHRRTYKVFGDGM